MSCVNIHTYIHADVDMFDEPKRQIVDSHHLLLIYVWSTYAADRLNQIAAAAQ